MNGSMIEKDELLTMLAGICNRLEQLDSVLKEAFTDLRDGMMIEEQNKLAAAEKKISLLESTLTATDSLMGKGDPDVNSPKITKTLKLEMGF